MAKKKSSKQAENAEDASGGVNGNVEEHSNSTKVPEPAQPQLPQLVICRNKYAIVSTNLEVQLT